MLPVHGAYHIRGGSDSRLLMALLRLVAGHVSVAKSGQKRVMRHRLTLVRRPTSPWSVVCLGSEAMPDQAGGIGDSVRLRLSESST